MRPSWIPTRGREPRAQAGSRGWSRACPTSFTGKVGPALSGGERTAGLAPEQANGQVATGRTTASLRSTRASVARYLCRAAQIAAYIHARGCARRGGGRLHVRWRADRVGALSRAAAPSDRRARRASVHRAARPIARGLVHAPVRKPQGGALDDRDLAAVRPAARLPSFPSPARRLEAGNLSPLRVPQRRTRPSGQQRLDLLDGRPRSRHRARPVLRPPVGSLRAGGDLRFADLRP